MRSEAVRELTWSIAALGAMLVLTALVAINLLQRMAPAFSEVLEENVNSMDAAGDMLASLAAARLPELEAAAARRRFLAALDDAARNRSEPEEAALIEELRAVEEAALSGEPLSMQRALRALDALRRVNRVAAQRANTEAQRLGTAGSWVVALLGALGFAANLFLARRLARRLLMPLHELSRVLAAVEQGDRLQRCATRGTPARQHELLTRLNRLLDTRLEQSIAQGARAEGSSGLTPWLLDGWDAALVLLDVEGRVLSANHAALELLAGERGPSLREAMNRARQGAHGEGVSTLRRSEHWVLMTLTPAQGASPVEEPSG
jgi:nitrogen fixation/metabolism regulation signal transduction histidine kinase